MLKGSLNRLWTVVPLGSSNDAIPVHATQMHDLSMDFSVRMMIVYRNVFPVPPGPSTK